MEERIVGFEEIWRRETYRLALQMFKLRFGLLPLLALIWLAFWIWDPVPWKLVWLGVTLAVTGYLSFFEYSRLQRSSAAIPPIQLNLAAMVLLQTLIIYVTGGIESPWLLIYIPLGLASGLALGSWPQALSVAALPILFSLVFAAGALGGWLPRSTPAFLGLGEGFYSNPVYVSIKAGLIMMLMLVTSSIGIIMRRRYDGAIFRALESRQETLEALDSRNHELLSVSATIAHELKNPLASIQGLAQLLAKEAAEGSKMAERLRVMQREIGRMGTVLEEFRTFTRPLSGLTLRPTRLGELMEDVVQLNEGLAGATGTTLGLTGLADAEVLCDPYKVKQALLNLVQNGLEAARGGRVEMELAFQAGDEAVEVRVKDSGPGLPPEMLAEPFQPGRTTKATGSGIGLVVARSIAEQHGGRLTLENRTPQGCQATLRLPLTPREESL